jgi:hypothetical protein
LAQQPAGFDDPAIFLCVRDYQQHFIEASELSARAADEFSTLMVGWRRMKPARIAALT